MKKAALLTLVALCYGTVYAQTPPQDAPAGPPGGPHQGPQDPARFAQFKQQILARQQQRVYALQQGIACISAAQNHDQLHACREQERQAMEQLQHHQ